MAHDLDVRGDLLIATQNGDIVGSSDGAIFETVSCDAVLALLAQQPPGWR